MGAWNMGMGGQWLTVRNAVMVWKVMVQSVLDYATEVFGGITGNWEGAEKIARKMGKLILGVRKSTANEVVMGELGWWSMKGRRDFLRLKYWGEIVSNRTGLRWEVYQEGRKRVGEDQSAWCDYTRRCLEELGLERFYDRQDEYEVIGKEWKGTVREKVQEKEQKEWLERMKKKAKLRTYREFKRELRRASYLWVGTATQRRVMTMIRGGSNDLCRSEMY